MTSDKFNFVVMAARIHVYLYCLKRESPQKHEQLETMIKSFNPEQARMFKDMTEAIEKNWQV